MYYAATWIHVPKDTQLDCTLLAGRADNPSFWVGDQKIDLGPPEQGGRDLRRARMFGKVISFRKGWNQVYYRGYCVQFGSALGMIIGGDPRRLWSIKVSGAGRPSVGLVWAAI